MRVLLVVDSMHPSEGGPPRVVVQSAAGLSQLGNDVEIIAPSPSESDDEDILNAWRDIFDSGIQLNLLRRAERFKKYVMRRSSLLLDSIDRADVVHIHGIWSPFLVLTGKVCRETGTPYLVSSHGCLDPWSLQQSRIPKLIASYFFGALRLLNRSSAVVFGSDDEAAAAGLIDKTVMRLVVPNGAVGYSGDRIDARSKLLEKYPALREWERILLFYSRIHPKKGLHLLIEAFSEIAVEHPNCGLLIAGLRQDHKHEEEIREQVKSGGLDRQVMITTDLSGPSSQFVYKACDAFILPSVQEGFPMAVLESLASGVPVVATDVCRLPEIRSSGAGIVVGCSVDEIREGVRQILEVSSAELDEMGGRAAGLASEKFQWDAICQKLQKEYREAK